MKRGLSEVIAALLSLVITLTLLAAFFAFNGGYFLTLQKPHVSSALPLLQPLYLIINPYPQLSFYPPYQGIILFIVNYGSSPVQVAYAMINDALQPNTTYVYLVEPPTNLSGQPKFIYCPTGEIQPGKEYAVVISNVPTNLNTYFITLVFTNGYSEEFVLSPGVVQ
ncbi:hypothetical protein EWF20_08030 [Sulfolobus sp. S-194]|uniref:hypothetical protein n=1 Tax=Sulfolobus sp. S-194 TaxID=2512240 RepID=UPI001436F57F|nr:hypothetical protein [Sulfolobus sp. S-194]QIW24098.1 hypothetical protein EWF20_08030 [Sulfolobus sp. S-194]